MLWLSGKSALFSEKTALLERNIQIRRDMKGMNKEEQKAYLMEYMGWMDKEPDQEGSDLWEPSDEDSGLPF